MTVDTAYSITARDGRFCLTRGGKPVKSGKGHDMMTDVRLLADETVVQLQQPRPRVFLLGYWQAVLDAEADEIAHMRQTLLEALEHDQLLYPAETPADFVPQQQAIWAEAKTWLATQGAVPQPTVWQGEDRLIALLDGLELPALVWVYGAARLLQSTALGLWALHGKQDAATLVKAGYSDELYQQARYKADDEVTARLGRIEADMADLCLVRESVKK